MTRNPLNRLDQETSPYLAALNNHPVNWYPWCRKAFAVARERNKPVLLSVGGPWCPWSRRMDAEALAAPAVAALVNQHFVAVKVDADEHPEVDRRYQEAAMLAGGQGGFPLTAFLTPDGQCFFAGTFFAAADDAQQMGLASVLTGVAQAWAENPQALQEKARAITAEVASSLAPQPPPAEAGVLQANLDQLALAHDVRHGGFFLAPKFPHPTALAWVNDLQAASPRLWQGQVLAASLEALTQGGLRDRLRGDFHRYAQDLAWHIPQWEKCLGPNAHLLMLLAQATLAGLPFQEETHGLAQALAGPWRRGDGLFHQALTPPATGENPFVFTLRELETSLTGEMSDLAQEAFGLTEAGHPLLPPGQHTLALAWRLEELAARRGWTPAQTRKHLEGIAQTLAKTKDRCGASEVYEDIFTAPQAAAVEALLWAGRALGDAALVESALVPLNGVVRLLFRAEEGFLHAVRGGGQGEQTRTLAGLLEDQSAAISALITAFEITGQRPHLLLAQEAATVVLRDYPAASGGFVDTPAEENPPGLMALPCTPWQDGQGESGNAQMIRNLLRLNALTGEAQPFAQAMGGLRALGGMAARQGVYAAGLARALWWGQRGVATVVVAGDPKSADFQWFHTQALALPPGPVVVLPLLAKQWPDPPTPLAQAVAALAGGKGAALLRQGKVLATASHQQDWPGLASHLSAG